MPKYKEYRHNPRSISAEQKNKLEDTLSRFGDLGGIIYNRTSKEFVGGNQRSKVMDFDSCEIEYIDKRGKPDKQGTVAWGFLIWQGARYLYREVKWDEEQEREANIVANKGGGDWNFDLLQEHFSKSDLLKYGFKEKELRWDDIDEKKVKAMASANESAMKYKVKPGDVISFEGRHTLICGDCTDEQVVRTVMDGRLARLYLTDPPYGVSYVGKTKEALTIQNDAMSAEETHDLFNRAVDAILPHLMDGGGCYATIPAGPLMVGFAQAFIDRDILRQILVWYKKTIVMGRSDYHYAHEPILYGSKPGEVVFNGSEPDHYLNDHNNLLYGWKPGAKHYFSADRTKGSVLEFPKPSKSELHPTMKPVNLWAQLIVNSSRPGEIVYDSFCGSGTTIIACEKTGRLARCVELDQVYCSKIIGRYLVDFPGSVITINNKEI